MSSTDFLDVTAARWPEFTQALEERDNAPPPQEVQPQWQQWKNGLEAFEAKREALERMTNRGR